MYKLGMFKRDDDQTTTRLKTDQKNRLNMKVIKNETSKNVKTQSDDKKVQDEFNKKLSKAIGCAIELEGNFKLYSYRVITPEVFLHRTDEIFDFYKKAK